jgi:hypothetical protein
MLMSSKPVAVLGFFCLLLAPVAIRAHHSFAAEFDAKKGLKITGSINKVEWLNPHVYFYLNATEVCEGTPTPDAKAETAAPGAKAETPAPDAPPQSFDWKCTKIDPSKSPNWGFEMGSPNGLMRLGWTRTSMKYGEVITVEGSVAKDGSNYGNARFVRLTDGRTLFAGSSQP